MNIAVIGGGINGIMTAWELLKQGHSVTLFEKGEVMKQTSSASSKLLHGGLRYLENFEFRLVKEALKERQWWISQAPHLAQPLKLYIPIYKTSSRPAWLYKIGLWLYDTLAGKQNIGKHQSLTKQQMHQACPQLKTEGLTKGFSFYDGQMDDHQLGLWALDQAKAYRHCERSEAISQIFALKENTEVTQVDENGTLTLASGETQTYDKIINAAGPWAEQLLKQSNIKPKYKLDLVRGSHILVDTEYCYREEQSKKHVHCEERGKNHGHCEERGKNHGHCEERSDAAITVQNHGYLLEVPNERRIFFVLPYQGKTLIGTTEQRQTLNDDIKPSEQEIDYLINGYNHYFTTPINKQNIIQSFAGLRPLIKSADNPNKGTREYALQQNQNLTTVFGGKWTTSKALSINICKRV
ncbi:MAG: FAD-dependent oxidoreductase [Shewanella sp. CG18_big_fil_WC_8_21_14_2_50_42_11]|uniref:glycerol-3-phosphate dehydrogenase/oxidase n=1 Tax=Shewanella sp. CG18_big_fil_WC_8_21_14_2_50_42_11 TaxID=1975538 RepID=UPI000C613EF1|nr:FAD-dependent oxidoreductase [Shewanella sp. CG18_big_fil_WC_8_21_14_2_50_42_11]PIP98579.1 MAG: FAD-dependent oxidoreductase [Shewanella sp. CG18_big_fil_WC_8_21_14_2_50_42_11]